MGLEAKYCLPQTTFNLLADTIDIHFSVQYSLKNHYFYQLCTMS